MLRPNCDIRIKNDAGKVLYFDFVSEVEIERSWQNLTSTATITLPRRIRHFSGQRINDLIQAGNEVTIRLGYDLVFVKEFHGFVTSVSSRVPVTITLEDRMWQLKQTSVTKSFADARLSRIIDAIVPSSTRRKVLDAVIGDWRFSKISAAMVLEHLKRAGMHSYFRDDVLCSGFAYPPEWMGNSSYRANYHFQKNIIDSGNLTFKAKNEVKVKVEAISMLPDNKSIKAMAGDPEGEHHTLHFYGITSEAELRRKANEELKRYAYEGYRGSFVSFGFPYADHGYTAELLCNEYPERRGSYFIDKVLVRYGTQGYRREVFLGAKATTS